MNARRSRLSADQRRESIIAAATQVFVELGYQRGTMAEVARRVGVTEPVVFQNFGSKAAVFAAVLEHAAVHATAGMRQSAADSESVGAWLARLLTSGESAHPEHAHAGAGAGAGGIHHVLFADAMAHAGDPLVTEAIRCAHHAVAGTVADLLARGQVEGSVRQDLDPEVGAWWVISFLHSRRFRAATVPDHARLEAELGSLTLHALVRGA